MPTFADNILTAMTDSTKDFIVDFVASYWPVILGITVIVFIGTRLLMMARMRG